MKKLFVFCFVALVALALAACSDNLFGKGDSGSDAKSLRLDAEDAFRKGNYSKAYEICNQIVANDSTASYGYYCAAQAGLWVILNPFSVTPFSLFNNISVKKMNDGEIPFLDELDTVKTLYYKAMSIANTPLKELHRRDSLTFLWELSKMSQSERAKVPNPPDSMEIRLNRFINIYCTQNKNCTDFPISDREYKTVAFSYDLIVTQFATTLLGVWDFNNDGCIAKRTGNFKDEDFNYWGCAVGDYDFPFNLIEENGKTVPDMSEAIEDIELIAEEFYSNPDNYDKLPPEVANVNDKFDSFEGDLQSTIDIMNQNDIPQSEDFEEEFNKYKKYVSFYRIGTHIDEDGDGCIDEGTLNGRVDGDGLKGANSRIADLPQIDNTMSGIASNNKIIEVAPPVCIKDGKNSSTCTVIDPDEETGKVNVLAFALTPDYWTSNDTDLKLAIAQDTVCGSIKFDLQYRKDNVGGCWGNYDDDKFMKYILKREWATANDKEKRVHPNCKTCRTIGECLGR